MPSTKDIPAVVDRESMERRTIRIADPQQGCRPSTKSFTPRSIPQPSYDFDVARISEWARATSHTVHVSINGKVDIRKKVRNV